MARDNFDFLGHDGENMMWSATQKIFSRNKKERLNLSPKPPPPFSPRFAKARGPGFRFSFFFVEKVPSIITSPLLASQHDTTEPL